MIPDGQSAMKQSQPPAVAAVRTRRILERMKGHTTRFEAEPPTLAYSIVYFTTVALLLTLCVQAVMH